MWGMTLGPISGQLLAEEIVTGRRPDALGAFGPLR
jgi:D-amino-acid dehydrogenase